MGFWHVSKPVKRRALPKYVTEFTVAGHTYVYFRRNGRKVKLDGVPWTEPFMADYRALLAGEDLTKRERKSVATTPGTMRSLCEAYFKSADFVRLDERTRKVRRQILQSCMDEKINSRGERVYADVPTKIINGRAIRHLRDLKAKDAPEAANARVKALRHLFAFAIVDEQIDKNPARDIPYIQTGSQGFHSWSIDEVEQFEARHPIGTKARLALALMLYTGQRRSDIVTFGRQHVRNGWLKFTQAKNRRNKPISLEIPIVKELREIIDASPCGDLTFLVTEFGRPFTVNGFGNWFRKRCDEAGLPHCSAHGLRKAAAARLADQGKSEHEIMSITGHQTSKEVTRYTKAARQKVLAARAFDVEDED